MNNTIGSNYKAAMQIFKDKKWTLCGLILLETVFALLAEVFGFLPIIILPLCFGISVSAAAICLKGVRGESVDSKNLFDGFKNFKHNIGGMAWMSLWVLIWVIVPIAIMFNIALSSVGEVISAIVAAGMGSYYSDSVMSAGSIVMLALICAAVFVGLIIMIIKYYTYCFTPYILTDKPEIHAMDAIKESKRLTMGIRGKIFWATVIPGLIIAAISVVIAVFARIPFIGVLFDIILSVFNIVASLFTGVFVSLTLASFYNNAAASPVTVIMPATPATPVATEAPAAPSAPVAPATSAPSDTTTPAPADTAPAAPTADEQPKAE